MLVLQIHENQGLFGKGLKYEVGKMMCMTCERHEKIWSVKTVYGNFRLVQNESNYRSACTPRKMSGNSEVSSDTCAFLLICFGHDNS